MGLSPGASIGIGVGVGVGACIIIVLAAMVVWMRRKRATATAKTTERQDDAATQSRTSSTSREKSAADWQQGPALPAKPWQQPAPVYEADDGFAGYQAGGMSELDGQWRGWEADPSRVRGAR
jgi:hypothetical protein